MQTTQMRYAVALAHHRHFGRAASALGTAQPSLSRQIARLERDLGVRLFDRSAQGVVPTAAGEAFLARARRSLTEAAAAEVDAHRAARAETGRLRIGFDSSALLRVLPDTLVLFSRSHPRVQLQMHEMSSAESGQALLRGRIDVAISRGAPRGVGAENVVSVPVERAHLVAVVNAGHPFAGGAPVTPGQLRGRRLIMTPARDEPAVASYVHRLLTADADTPADAGSPAGVVEARDLHTIIGLAACGIGVGLVPDCARAALRPDTRLCEITPTVELPGLVVSHNEGDPSPVVRAFLTTACDRMTDH